MSNCKPIICKDLTELIERKLSHDVKYLLGIYLDDDKENEIKKAINARDLMLHYNLESTSHKNRCICPFHLNADNPTSFEFDDTKGAFRCHACGVHGTYIKFIVMMENFTDNPYAEAKILAANNFANMPLGFGSISDFKNQLSQLVIERYTKTKSLLLNDYFDISLIGPMPTTSTRQQRSETIIATPAIQIKNTSRILKETKSKEFRLETLDLEKVIREINADDVIKYGDFKYRIDLGIAKKSKLIKGFEDNPALNSRETLYEFMHKKYDISPEIADKYGIMAFKKDNQSLLEYPDFFMINDRVLFPFTDHNSGITVGYQARTMNLDIKNVAKYLNISDFGDIVTKKGKTYRELKRFGIGNFLFNLYQIKDKDIDRLFITEGVADALKLISLGYDCISPGQPNLTDHQIYLINEYFGKEIELIIFYDNDTNNIGQNKSLTNAYRLFQFGFKNIGIIRTFGELGTDITDVAIKIRNDSTLKTLVDLWINNAYKFKPADNKVLNNIYQTGFFSETQLKQLDPRNIEKINNNIDTYVRLMTKLGTKNQEAENLKILLDCNNTVLELIEAKINNLTELDTSSTSKLDKLKDTTKLQENVPHTDTPLQDENKRNNNDSISHSTEDLPKENWDAITNITSAQLFRLKKRFDYQTILRVDDLCTKKQIQTIVGYIIKDIPFDINDFFHMKKSEKISKNTISFDSDFRPAEDDPDLMPF